MTNQQPIENTISIEQIQAAFAQAFGPTIGQLVFQKLNLEMQIQALQARLADIETKAFGIEQDNARLIKAQIALEDEGFGLKAENTTLTNRNQELEAELSPYRAFATEGAVLSPDSAKIATEGDAAILASAGNEKAAPD